MAIPNFTKYIMDADLEAKINTFLPEGNTVELIIAGDSRAERQLIPALFKSEQNLETVNIAKDVGDVMSLVYANKKYEFADSGKIFVLGLSSLLTNDGAYENWFMSQASITEIGLVKQLLLFKSDYIENWYHRMGLIWDDLINDKRGIRLPQEDIRVKYNGYIPIDEYLDINKFFVNNLNPKTTKHLWYRKPNNNGIRKTVFEKSLEQFSKTGVKITIIQSPMASAWRSYVGENYMHQLELEYSRFLVELAAQYKNVWVIDFYTKQPSIFTDDLFYNATHLNKTGAITFTKAVIDSLRSKGVID
jgi:hypothetical protein